MQPVTAKSPQAYAPAKNAPRHAVNNGQLRENAPARGRRWQRALCNATTNVMSYNMSCIQTLVAEKTFKNLYLAGNRCVDGEIPWALREPVPKEVKDVDLETSGD